MKELTAVVIGLVLATAIPLHGQENYEIQVYPSATMAPGVTLWELHSNWTVNGVRTVVDGVVGNHRAYHGTFEITRGFNDWFEVGFYLFSTIQPGESPAYVGNHIRPRFRIPPSWGWPVGVSLSQEIGFQRRRYSEETWSWEIRPIIDRKVGRLYWAINPTLGVPLQVDSGTSKAVEIAPNIAINYDVSPKVNLGVEYYGSVGTFRAIPRLRDQSHMIYPTVNLYLAPELEFNAGVGIGLTPATEKFLLKLILGYRTGLR